MFWLRLRIEISSSTLIFLGKFVEKHLLVLFLKDKKKIQTKKREHLLYAKPVSLLICLSSADSSYSVHMSGVQQSIEQCFHNSCCPCSCHTEYRPGYEPNLTKKQIINILWICSQLN